jgi:uncharacterized protein
MPSSPNWNRRLHYYLGLYFLLFLWLFAFSGLLLNHPQWSFAEFWPLRAQTHLTRAVQAPPAGGDVERARDLMRQLDLRGEIEWTQSGSPPGRFDFRITRPGHIVDVKIDWTSGQATVERIDLNGWGKIRLLHSFTGVRPADAVNTRDWSLTVLWVLCMDALALGVVLMALSGMWLWWCRAVRRTAGALAVLLGALCCGFFVIGLRYLP